MHPVGREIFRDAKIVEHDTRAYSALPYHSAQVCGDGWAIAGDAASFIDPLYSPGLDLCAYTTSVVSDLVTRALEGEDVAELRRYYNEQFATTYRFWFETLYKDKIAGCLPGTGGVAGSSKLQRRRAGLGAQRRGKVFRCAV